MTDTIGASSEGPADDLAALDVAWDLETLLSVDGGGVESVDDRSNT